MGMTPMGVGGEKRRNIGPIEDSKVFKPCNTHGDLKGNDIIRRGIFLGDGLHFFGSFLLLGVLLEVPFSNEYLNGVFQMD